jgi:hypothetical protein
MSPSYEAHQMRREFMSTCSISESTELISTCGTGVITLFSIAPNLCEMPFKYRLCGLY